jgi:ubiquinone/menaquinone biosynthesis C-methylase UbiE
VSERVWNVALEHLLLRPGDALLDVGCGDGQLARQFVAAGFAVVGVEPSERLRNDFTAAGRDLDSSVYHVVDGYAENLPFEDASWRAILMTEVLEHVADPNTVLRELHRVLAPGGRLCVSVPTSFTERFYSRVHPRYTENATHVRVFTKAALFDVLERAGFRVVAVEGKNFVPAILWLFHALLRSDADHTGAINENVWISHAVGGLFAVLERLRLRAAVTAAGDRVFPKSWYVYAEKAG